MNSIVCNLVNLLISEFPRTKYATHNTIKAIVEQDKSENKYFLYLYP
ncbi:hypothetical protein [Clostridium sp. LS]|nr:hypothetical protein [Clostridium sp. LS]